MHKILFCRIYITDKDIVQDQFAYNSFCSSGNRLEIGSAVSSEISMTILNHELEAQYNSSDTKVSASNINFCGIEATVDIGVYDGTDILYFRLGRFTFDRNPFKFSTIELTALDRMMKFDVPAERKDFATTYTISTLIDELCTISGVNKYPQGFPQTLVNMNCTIDIDKLFENNQGMTLRQILLWVCQIVGANAFIYESGSDSYLNFRWVIYNTGFLNEIIHRKR